MSTSAATARLTAARDMFADTDAARVLFGGVQGDLGTFATGAFFGLRQLARRLPDLTGAAADEVDLLLTMFGGAATAAPAEPPRSTRPLEAASCLDLSPAPSFFAPLLFALSARWDLAPATCWDPSPPATTP